MIKWDYSPMYAHKDIWQAIDRLAEGAGYSASGLAKKAGLDPTTFNKSKRISGDGKPRWPSTESIAKILAVTNMTMSEFFTLAGDEGGAQIPVMRLDQAGSRANAFGDDGRPSGKGWDKMAFPGGSGFFALEVGDDSMKPAYREGDILVLSPSADIRRGDRVVVKTKKGIFAGEFVRRTEIKNFGSGTEEFDASDIQWMARVVWVSQ